MLRPLTTWTNPFPKKHKSRESLESEFGLIHWIFVAYGFIGFIILFWFCHRNKKSVFGSSIRIRIFPEEMHPMATLTRLHLASFPVTPKTLSVLVWTLPFSYHFHKDLSAYVFIWIYFRARFYIELTESLNASKQCGFKRKCTSVGRA